MAKAKLKNLKNGIEPGTKIPCEQSYGNVGNWAENVLKENGHTINKTGIDISDLGLEVKTRKNGSSSYHTIGSMNVNDIINTPYDQSSIREKTLTQYRIHYNDQFQVVASAEVYDFSDNAIQDKIREAYEGAREMMRNGDRNNWIRKEVEPGVMAWGAFEGNGNSYYFRIASKHMNDMETMAKSTFNKNFHVS